MSAIELFSLVFTFGKPNLWVWVPNKLFTDGEMVFPAPFLLQISLSAQFKKYLLIYTSLELFWITVPLDRKWAPQQKHRAPRWCWLVQWVFSRPGPDFIELQSTKSYLAWNFFVNKNRITNEISICCILLVIVIQLLFAYPENHIIKFGW